MATNVDLKSGKCKVNISVGCPCKLFVQGLEYDAVPGDVISLEQKYLFAPASFFIEVKELSSVLTRVVSLRRDLAGRLNAVRKVSRPDGLTYERGYLSCRENTLVQVIGMLDEILEVYSL